MLNSCRELFKENTIILQFKFLEKIKMNNVLRGALAVSLDIKVFQHPLAI